MAEEVLEIFKPYGKTPKEMVDICIQKYNAKKGCFSGRLDPMACGIMRIYLDDFCKLAAKHNKLNKKYRFKFVFGISTTSCDLLGIPLFHSTPKKILNLSEIQYYLQTLQKEYIQSLPHHSSFILKNKKGEKHPLWWWTKETRLDEIQIPCFNRTLFDFHFINKQDISLKQLCLLAKERISYIDRKHKFNFIPILNEWENLEMINEIYFEEFEFIITVSSGFYVRKLVEDIGLFFNVQTLTTDIERMAYVM